MTYSLFASFAGAIKSFFSPRAWPDAMCIAYAATAMPILPGTVDRFEEIVRESRATVQP